MRLLEVLRPLDIEVHLVMSAGAERTIEYELGRSREDVAALAAGAVILPPVPAFYHRPQSVEELIDHTVTKILDQFGIHLDLIRRWEGI